MARPRRRAEVVRELGEVRAARPDELARERDGVDRDRAEPRGRSAARSPGRGSDRSKRALCATSTASPAKARKRRTAAPTGGARRSSASRRPVSAAIVGAERRAGVRERLEALARARARSTRTAPISQIRAPPRRQSPVVSRSTTTKVACSSGRSPRRRGGERDEVARASASRASAADRLLEQAAREPDGQRARARTGGARPPRPGPAPAAPRRAPRGGRRHPGAAAPPDAIRTCVRSPARRGFGVRSRTCSRSGAASRHASDR